MRTPRIITLTGLALASVALTACSVSVAPTADPDDIAALAEDALEQQVGLRPVIDCGSESIPLEEGSTVPCLLTDPNTGSEFDTEVTLSEVDGTNISVSVQVAEEPNG